MGNIAFIVIFIAYNSFYLFVNLMKKCSTNYPFESFSEIQENQNRVMTIPIFSKRGSYVFFQPPDPIDVVGVKALAYKIDEICKQLRINKVLVDARNRTSPPHNTEQLLEIAKFVADYIQDRIQFAVLVDYMPEVHDFFQSITDLHGVELRFFEEEAAAKKWLNVEEN